MAELVLMERDFDRMYVPGDKVQAFLADGWKEIERKPAEPSAPVAAETTPPAEPEDKSKGKGRDK